MKSLLLTLVLVISTQVYSVANAAQVELGKYSALDVETKSIRAELVLKEGGFVAITISTPDISKIPCEGKYSVIGNEFLSEVKCVSALLAEAKVKIDVTNVNPESVRTVNGVEVDVSIDALGNTPMKFMLKKAD